MSFEAISGSIRKIGICIESGVTVSMDGNDIKSELDAEAEILYYGCLLFAQRDVIPLPEEEHDKYLAEIERCGRARTIMFIENDELRIVKLSEARIAMCGRRVVGSYYRGAVWLRFGTNQ